MTEQRERKKVDIKAGEGEKKEWKGVYSQKRDKREMLISKKDD